MLKLSPIIYGTMGFENPSERERIRVIHCALDSGMSSLDTAPLYGCGDAERIVGKAIKGRRDEVQVLTKCGLRWDSNVGTPMFPVIVEGGERMMFRNCRPESVTQEVEASLVRLNTDVIDLIQVHRWDPEIPIEETVGALVRLREAGKVLQIGLSDHPLEQMRRAHRAVPGGLFSSQNEYNPIRRESEKEALGFARREDLAFIAYSSLGQGVLAGRQLGDRPQPTGGRAKSPYFHPKNLSRLNAVLSAVALPLAEKYSITLSQLCLQWILAQEGVSSALAGGRTEEQVRKNAAAAVLNVGKVDLDAFGSALERCGWDPTPEASMAERAKSRIGGLLRRFRP
jgi:aryl-alcohol dehydrogenase-like predicted oxidoreductase